MWWARHCQASYPVHGQVLLVQYRLLFAMLFWQLVFSFLFYNLSLQYTFHILRTITLHFYKFLPMWIISNITKYKNKLMWPNYQLGNISLDDIINLQYDCSCHPLDICLWILSYFQIIKLFTKFLNSWKSCKAISLWGKWYNYVYMLFIEFFSWMLFRS